MNRTFLGRALRLGFGELEVVDAGSPVVCRAGRRVFAWQPLSQESALEPADDVIRIESTTVSHEPAHEPDEAPTVRTPMTEQLPHANRPSGDPVTHGSVPAPGSPAGGGPGLVALIQEAVALHEALGDARTRSQRLIAALRRHRKQARLMTGALEALKQLRLQDVAAE